MKFRDVFDQVGRETVRRNFLGLVCADLLAVINPKINDGGDLHELMLTLMEPHEILLNKKMRDEITNALSLKEAEKLAEELKLRSSDSVYEVLKELRVQKGTKKENIILEFFGVKKPEIEPIAKHPSVEMIEPQKKLFEHQRNVVNEAIEHLDADPRRLIIHMPTGSGKTLIAMRIITHYLLEPKSKLVVWLTYSEELCEQAIEEFREMWGRVGDRTLKVYRFFGKHSNIDEDKLPDEGFLVGGLSKMYKADTGKNRSLFLSKLADKTTMVVMDEAHQAVAKTYKYVLEQLIEKRGGKKLLGLTATPGRTWNEPDEDKKLSKFFCNHKVTLNKKDPIEFLVNEGYLANIETESIHRQYEKGLSKKEKREMQSELDIPKSVLEKIASDVQRNLSVLRAVDKLIDDNHQRVILFAATVEHARALAAGLIVMGISAQYVTSDTPPDTRRRQIQKYKEDGGDARVMCNYGVLTAGFDAPRTSAAVIARPTKSLVLYSQMVGRAMRGPKVGGNEKSKIVSVVDTNLPGFRDFSDGFTNWEDIW